MALDATTKLLLNKFADSQPALQIPGHPAATASLQLGDLMEEALDGGTAVDQTARDAADAAQSTADGAASAASDAQDTADNALTQANNANAALAQKASWSRMGAEAAQINSFGTGVEHAYASAEQAISINATIMRVFLDILTTFTDNGTVLNAGTSTIKIGIDNLSDDCILGSTLVSALSAGSTYMDTEVDGAVANFLRNGGVASNLTLTWTAGSGDATALVTGELVVKAHWLA